MHSLLSVGRRVSKDALRRFSAGMMLTSLAVCVGFPATTGGVAFGAPEPDSALAGMANAPAVQIQRVSFSDCDAEGNREVRVAPRLVPADARDVIVQWYLDGEPVGPTRTPSPFFGSLPSDGRSHLVEVRTLTPAGATGASEEVTVAVCATAVGDVRTVEPARMLDTRSNGRTIDGVAEGVGRLGAASSIEVDIGGRAGSPGNTSAAVINLTAINPSTKGFATAYPCTDQVPNASTINYSQGVNIANSTTVKLSDARSVVRLHVRRIGLRNRPRWLCASRVRVRNGQPDSPSRHTTHRPNDRRPSPRASCGANRSRDRCRQPRPDTS